MNHLLILIKEKECSLPFEKTELPEEVTALEKEALPCTSGELLSLLSEKTAEGVSCCLAPDAFPDELLNNLLSSPLLSGEDFEIYLSSEGSEEGFLLRKTESEKEASEICRKDGVPSLPHKPSLNKRVLPLFETVQIFCATFAVLLIVMTVLVRHSPVVGSSMSPTLEEGDILLVSGYLYTPERGDIIVVQTDGNGKGGSIYRPLVKRVIALEGDKVTVNFRTWEITVNGEAIDQSYLGHDYLYGASMNSYGMGQIYGIDENGCCSFTVSEGHIFFMGDNRNDSLDCRTFGEIDERDVVGKVLLRIYPLSKIGIPD